MGFVGPFTYNGVRFALGSLSLLPLVCLRRNAPVSRRPPLGRGRAALLRYGLAAGAVLFTASSLQQLGMVTTSAGKAGFITGLYVVLVPLSGLLWGQKAGWGRFLGAALAVAGLYLLSVTGDFVVARGDLLVLASALFWTAHVHLIGWASPRVDSLELAALQFAVCSVLSLLAALLTESVRIEGILAAAAPILYGGLASVGIGYTLQVVVQKTAHPTHAAILLSLEGVFAVVGGWLLLGESLSTRGLTGCLLMLAGMLASQAASPRPRKVLDDRADRRYHAAGEETPTEER
jgi:drug/metabolite transporter (DMT)-like permease